MRDEEAGRTGSSFSSLIRAHQRLLVQTSANYAPKSLPLWQGAKAESAQRACLSAAAGCVDSGVVLGPNAASCEMVARASPLQHTSTRLQDG